MNKKMEWLKRYSETCGVSGFEGPMKTLLLERMGDKAKVSYDKLGSVIFTAEGPKNAPKLMLASHMDEIGFMVKHITKEGFLRFVCLGGWWEQVMLSQRVTVHGQAMTREQAVEAIKAGMKVANDCIDQGYNLLATAEMGIGNTTSTAAMASAILDLPPELTVGRGSGINDERMLILLGRNILITFMNQLPLRIKMNVLLLAISGARVDWLRMKVLNVSSVL